MEVYSNDKIIEKIDKIKALGHGRVLVIIVDHKVARCEATESEKFDDSEKGNRPA
jgi:hypothetical protein